MTARTATRPRRAAAAGGAPMDARIRRRRAAVRYAARQRRRRQIASVVALLVIGILAVLLARSPLFAIAAVRIEGADPSRVVQVREVAAVDVGRNLLEADLAAARRRVAALPWVDEARVELQPPSAVVISVTPRDAAANLVTARASWLVGAGGRLIAGGADPDVPTVVLPDAAVPPLGEPVDDAGLQAALTTIGALDDAIARRVVHYEAEGDQVTAVLDVAGLLPAQDELRVALGSPRRLDEKATVATSMIDVIAERQARAVADEEAVDPVMLDVRAAANPVLRPAPEEPGDVAVDR